jgi:hypothetical protein
MRTNGRDGRGRFTGRDEATGQEEAAEPTARECREAAFAAAVRSGHTAQALGRQDNALAAFINEAGAEHSLRFEIGALRVLVARTMAVEGLEGDLHATARTVSTLTAEIARLRRVDAALNHGATTDFMRSVDIVIGELESEHPGQTAHGSVAPPDAEGGAP